MGIGSRDRVRLFKIIGIGMGWHGWGWQLPHDRAPVALHACTSRPRFSARSSDARTADMAPAYVGDERTRGQRPELAEHLGGPGSARRCGGVPRCTVASCCDPAVLARHRRLARRTQRRLAHTGTCAGGARRAVRHPGLGHQPRRGPQVLGNSPWGVRDSIPLTPPQTIRALDSVQPTPGRGPAVRRADRYPCAARDFLCCGAKRSGPGDVAVGAARPGAPRLSRDHRA